MNQHALRPAMGALKPVVRLPSQLHAAAVQNGHLLPSPPQRATLPLLDALAADLAPYQHEMRHHAAQLAAHERARSAAVARELAAASSSGALAATLRRMRYAARGHPPDAHPAALPNAFYGVPEPPAAPLPPRGLYLHGDVGCGKTLLMDMLFTCAEPVLAARRVHYHPFMISVYEHIHRYDVMSPADRAAAAVFHPLDAVVRALGRHNAASSGAGLLCFDEFQVNDVADARLMHGVFTRLMRSGTVVCFTANRAPADLNRSQLLDADFRPFLDLLHDRCHLARLDGLDYRHVLDAADGDRWYFRPHEEQAVRHLWRRETGTDWHDVVTAVFPVAYGRSLTVSRASPTKTAVQMTTAELIDAPVGASDFRALAENTRILFISDVVPTFTSDTRNLARRFITLVDVCYEEKVRIVMRTESETLDGMFSGVEAGSDAMEIAEGLQFETEVAKDGVGAGNRAVGVGTVYTGEDEAFAFRRAISRLKEMRTRGFDRRKPALW